MLISLILLTAWKYHRAFVFTAIFLLCSVVVAHDHSNGILVTNIVNSSKLIQTVHAQEHILYKINAMDAKQIAEHNKFFEEKLYAGETYFDYSNQSLFFAFTKKNNPIYINQCPGMINGNKGQLQSLAYLREMKPRFVVMPYKDRTNEPDAKKVKLRKIIGVMKPWAEEYVYPKKLQEVILEKLNDYDERWSKAKSISYGCSPQLDGLLNLDRYYHITEYVTDNYRPYCTMGNFAVWCLKSEYDALCEEDKLNNIQREYIDYTYEQQDNHRHELGYIPYLWGKCAIKGDDVDFVRKTETGKYLIADNMAVMGDSGFIVLRIESSCDGEAEVIMQGKGIENISYRFVIKKGTHLYRLRVSNDLLWFSHRIEELIVNGEDVKVLNVCFEKILASELE